MRPLRMALTTGSLTGLLGLVAWVGGVPALFPSLGPTAYALATAPDAPTSQPPWVVGGHAIGVIAGLACYHAVGGGAVVTSAFAPLSTTGLRLAASGCLAVALTTAGMLATRYQHPPACATTLIVALGLLPTLRDGLVVVLAVSLMVGVTTVLDRAVPASEGRAAA